MKMLKSAMIGLGLLALVGCNNLKKEYGCDGFKVEKKSLNTTIVYTHDRYFNRDSLMVLRHYFGKSYYFEDYGCDGTVDMIHLCDIKEFLYKKDPITGEEINCYERVFNKAGRLLNKYKLELKIDASGAEYYTSEKEKPFVEYLESE